jgi:diguanylate cyclase (GGDEF)-like protein
MVELLSRRRLLVAAAATLYAIVFGALWISERTDLGIGRFFYLAIAVLALATGPLAGAAAGVLGLALYSIAVVHSSQTPTATLWSSSNGFRIVTYIALGVLVGAIAQNNRELLARLRFLADSDPLTGLGNSRSFGAAIAQRFERGKPFALLIGDMDSLKQINDDFGHAVGDETLKQLATVLSQSLIARDVSFRIGGDEFAVLADQDTAVGAARLAARLEASLAAAGQHVSFGWAVTPEDGDTAISLYRAADNRMYARKRESHETGARLTRVPDSATVLEA